MTKPVLKKNPLRCSSGYTLDAYCQYDNPDHPVIGSHAGVQSFFGRDKGEVLAQARKMGWEIKHHTWLATCPICMKAFEKTKIEKAAEASAEYIREAVKQEKKNTRGIDPYFHMGKRK